MGWVPGGEQDRISPSPTALDSHRPGKICATPCAGVKVLVTSSIKVNEHDQAVGTFNQSAPQHTPRPSKAALSVCDLNELKYAKLMCIDDGGLRIL